MVNVQREEAAMFFLRTASGFCPNNFSLRRFYQIPGHGLPLRSFAITLIGHNTLGRTPLDEWSDRRRYLYLTTLTTRRPRPWRDSNLYLLYSDWGFSYHDWGFPYPDWGFSARFPQLQGKCQGKTRKDGARPALFKISCYLCCSVVICVVLCIVCL
jgi:hypothetical protein